MPSAAPAEGAPFSAFPEARRLCPSSLARAPAARGVADSAPVALGPGTAATSPGACGRPSAPSLADAPRRRPPAGLPAPRRDPSSHPGARVTGKCRAGTNAPQAVSPPGEGGLWHQNRTARRVGAPCRAQTRTRGAQRGGRGLGGDAPAVGFSGRRALAVHSQPRGRQVAPDAAVLQVGASETCEATLRSQRPVPRSGRRCDQRVSSASLKSRWWRCVRGL